MSSQTYLPSYLELKMIMTREPENLPRYVPQVTWKHNGKHRIWTENFVSIPLEKKQVEVIVFLGEEIAKDASGVPTADLIGWQAKVDALDKVPELRHKVLVKLPGKKVRKTP